jgi:hypothetical protein
LFTQDLGSNQDQAKKSLKTFCKYTNKSDPKSFVKVKAVLKNRDQATKLLEKIDESKSKLFKIEAFKLANTAFKYYLGQVEEEKEEEELRVDLEIQCIEKGKLNSLLEILKYFQINLHSISIYDKYENICNISSLFNGNETLTILESTDENFSTKKSKINSMKYHPSFQQVLKIFLKCNLIN